MSEYTSADRLGRAAQRMLLCVRVSRRVWCGRLRALLATLGRCACRGHGPAHHQMNCPAGPADSLVQLRTPLATFMTRWHSNHWGRHATRRTACRGSDAPRHISGLLLQRNGCSTILYTRGDARSLSKVDDFAGARTGGGIRSGPLSSRSVRSGPLSSRTGGGIRSPVVTHAQRSRSDGSRAQRSRSDGSRAYPDMGTLATLPPLSSSAALGMGWLTCGLLMKRA